MNPPGEPSGTVTRKEPVFVQPPPRTVTIEIKSTVLPITAQMSYSWWATVDRHPWSDKRGYDTSEEALEAAKTWAEVNYPGRTIVYAGGPV